jgi:hypothetical protein
MICFAISSELLNTIGLANLGENMELMPEIKITTFGEAQAGSLLLFVYAANKTVYGLKVKIPDMQEESRFALLGPELPEDIDHATIINFVNNNDPVVNFGADYLISLLNNGIRDINDNLSYLEKHHQNPIILTKTGRYLRLNFANSVSRFLPSYLNLESGELVDRLPDQNNCYVVFPNWRLGIYTGEKDASGTCKQIEWLITYPLKCTVTS